VKNWKRYAIGAGTALGMLAFGVGSSEARSAPLVPSWEGFYIGADAGYGMGVTATSTQPFNTNFVGAHGRIGGVLAGYNHMVAPRWLLGVEGDVSAADIETSANASSPGNVRTASVAQGLSSSLRARAGYLLAPEILLYATGGWDWSHFAASSTVPAGSTAISAWLGGPQVGAGVEAMLSPHWIARLEYLETFYGSWTIGASPTGQGNGSVRPSLGEGRVALIHGFGPESAENWGISLLQPRWSGFYVGGALGAGVGTARLESPQRPGVMIDGIGAAGIVPTLMAGYNWRVAPQWVLGVEGEMAPGVSTTDFRIDTLEALRVRLGYLLTSSTMLYGNAGWLGTGIRSTSLIQGNVIVPSQRINALEIGGGVETALTEHWAARFDYQYAFAAPVDTTVVANIVDFNFSIVNFCACLVSAHAQLQVARVGIVYIFNGRETN
jgi:outer membrane immunogenic protein